MQWNWLISPLAGSIIGYGTNYLAIKMLFKPHNTKYIGKMKVPFTPGLIPKEKDTLARQIGETVEEHLLNEDVLVETLTSTKTKEAFFALIAKVPLYMEKSDETINDMVKKVLGKGLEQSLATAGDQLIVDFISLLGSREVMDIAIPYLVEALTKIVEESIGNEIHRDALSLQIQKASKTMLGQEEVKEYVYKALDDLETKTYQMLEEHAHDIGKNMIQSITQGEEAEKIKDSIKHWAEEQFNPMVLMFINIDKIYDGAIEYAFNALDEPEKKDKFAKLLCKVVKDTLHEPTSFIFTEEDELADYKNKVITMIQNQMNLANTEFLLEVVEREYDKKKETLQSFITQWLYDQWEAAVNTEEIFELSKKILGTLVKGIGETPLSNLSRLIPAETHGEIREQIFEIYREIITNNSKTIVEVMDISALVESKINQFSSQEAEEIILSVVKNQLRGITWIGALLGFVIGMLPNLIR